jgi:L-ribulose-5-phosphate 3-epimerase
MNRRRFIGACPAPLLSLLPRSAVSAPSTNTLGVSISLAQWSLHRTFFGDAYGPSLRTALQQDPDSVLRGARHPLEFPALARELFGIGAVEYVNTFFFGHAADAAYLRELGSRADDAGVQSLLIMCDALGSTGDADLKLRARAVENHLPWMDAAAHLGCHAIRVNAAGDGDSQEVSRRVADSLNRLGDQAASRGIDVLVENHGGLSSDGGWLAATIALADHPRVGTLPDFGNFRLSGSGPDAVFYDRYRGVGELMPFARAVSAKSYDFDAEGLETTIDYARMLRIVVDSGYRGHIGIEYEGSHLSEVDGIRATQHLLERCLATLDGERADQPLSRPS